MKHPFVLLCLSAVLTQVTMARKPNILFIMSDDHTSQAVGAYGGRLAKLNPTPTIDRLAREGMLMKNVFCTNAICTPSRASVITGQYPHTNGVFDLGGKIESDRQFLAKEMKQAGYHTAMVGKWHLKEEPGAFDYYKVLPGQGKFFNPEFRVRGDKPWPKNVVTYESMHSSDAITDITLKWLKEGWNQNKPFFLMHHYKAPHDYFENAPRYQSYLADVDLPQPDSLHAPFEAGFGSLATRGVDDELTPHIGTSIGDRNPRRSYAVDLPKLFPEEFPKNYDPAKYTAAQIRNLSYNAYLRKYLRCVKGIDDNLARLFQHLEETGQFDHTLVIYTGDQGFMLGEHDYQDKRWMYEEAQRMPFLVRFPKSIKAGSVSDALIENVDFAPTMLAFAGVKTPSYMQGRSFKQILESGKEPEGWKQAVYYRYWMHMAHHDNPGHMGIRTKNHKLIYFYGCNYTGGYRTPPAWELYDMKSDPHESTNQYDHPEYQSVVTDLKQRLAALRTQVGDSGEHYPAVEKVVQAFWDYGEADREKAKEISKLYKKRRVEWLENPPKKKWPPYFHAEPTPEDAP